MNVIALAAVGLALSGAGRQAAPPAVQSVPVRLTVARGVKVIVAPEPGSDLVAIAVCVRAGVEEEGRWPGVGSLVARALFAGNDNQSGEAVMRSIMRAAGSLETTWHPDYTLISCVTTGAQFREAFYSIAQALKTAEFGEAALGAAKRSCAADARDLAMSRFDAAFATARKALWPNTPSAGPWGTTPDRLRRITREVATGFYRACYTPQRTTIAVAGGITVDAVKRSAENNLVDYDRPEAIRRDRLQPPQRTADRAVLSVGAVGPPALLLQAFASPAMSASDYPSSTVLAAIIGGGKSSRLFRQVRDRAGVGYIAAAHVMPMFESSVMLAYVEADAERLASAATLAKDAVLGVASGKISDAELQRAKRYVTGSYALAHQRAADRAFHLAWWEASGAGYEMDEQYPRKVMDVTMADVSRAAKEILGRGGVTVLTKPVQ